MRTLAKRRKKLVENECGSSTVDMSESLVHPASMTQQIFHLNICSSVMVTYFCHVVQRCSFVYFVQDLKMSGCNGTFLEKECNRVE